jgi:hypothetical protein
MALAQTIPVAPHVARQNRPGVVPAVSGGRSSQILNLIVPANKPIQLFQAGQQFYLVLATGTVKIKPNNGSENTYTQGKGQIVPPDNQFSSLQLTNPNPFDIIVSIFVGFGDYIDNTVILFNPQVNSVVYPTFPVIAAANNVTITDRSGSAFVDPNGNSWLALQRTHIYITNYDLGLTYGIKNVANSQTILGVLPQTNVVLDFAGTYQINDAANLQLIICEVYMAIVPGLV